MLKSLQKIVKNKIEGFAPKHNVTILKVQVKNINNSVSAIKSFFGSTEKMMNHCRIVGGVVDLPTFYFSVPCDKLVDFKRVLLETKSNFSILINNANLSNIEINSLLSNYKN